MVYHDLAASEKRTGSSVAAASIDYTSLNTLTGTAPSTSLVEADGGEDDVLLEGRISSANLYALGPVTADRAYGIVRARADKKQEALEVTAQKKAGRDESKTSKLEAIRESVAGVLPKSAAEVEALTIPKLQGLLLRDDGQKWETAHSKLKAKGELVAAVKALYGSRLLLLAPPPPQMLALPPPQ